LSGDSLESAIKLVKRRIIVFMGSKLENGDLIRTIVKSLLLLGANLSQAREYRDVFEDILTKVCVAFVSLGRPSAQANIPYKLLSIFINEYTAYIWEIILCPCFFFFLGR
jgi:hypothetical protein